MPPTPASLAFIRSRVEAHFMPDAFNLVRTVMVSSGNGGYHPSPSTKASGLCRLRATNQQSQEQVIADRLGWVASYAIDLPVSYQPKPGDQLVVTATGQGPRTFEVGGIIRNGTFGITQTCVVKEIG